jgi:hypothetical protein
MSRKDSYFGLLEVVHGASRREMSRADEWVHGSKVKNTQRHSSRAAPLRWAPSLIFRCFFQWGYKLSELKDQKRENSERKTTRNLKAEMATTAGMTHDEQF